MAQSEPFVKADVIGEYLDLDPATVVRFTKLGIIPGHALRINGDRTHWRYLRSEVRQAMQRNAGPPPQ